MANSFVYGSKKVSWDFFFLQKRVLNLAHEYSRRLRGYMHNFVEDLHVLEFFKVAQ